MAATASWVNVWGVGYRLVDGPPPELAARARADRRRRARRGVAGLPLLGVAAPPVDAAVLASWLLAAVGLGLGAFWRLQLLRRRELVARACHELRGPLTAAHLALHGGVRGGDAPPARLAAVDRELDRAAVALDDLAAARNGRLAPDRDDPVDIGDLLACQALTWRMVAGVLGCRLELVESGAGAMVRGDRARLTQAVSNLVANAFEHGDGPVRCRRASTGDRVRIEVADDGPGLPAPVAPAHAAPARRARPARARPGHRGRHRRPPRRAPGGGADRARGAGRAGAAAWHDAPRR